MKSQTVDRVVGVASALVTPLMTLLTVFDVTTAPQAAAVGSVLAGLAVGFHGAKVIGGSNSVPVQQAGE